MFFKIDTVLQCRRIAIELNNIDQISVRSLQDL